MCFQNNAIRCTLTNIMSIDEIINETNKDDLNINKSEKWLLSQSIPLQYILSSYHHLRILHMVYMMVINEKGGINLAITISIYVKSRIKH